MNIAFLLDDRAGNCSQVMGVGKALQNQQNCYIQEYKFSYNWFGKWPNIVRGSSLKGAVPRIKITEKPDVVISAGRRSAPIARGIKKKYPQTFLCHMMWPETGIDDFDLIALPMHDEKKYDHYKNTFFTLTTPGKLLPDDFNKIDAIQFANLPKPHTVVLVGGSNKHGVFSIEHAQNLANDIQKLQQDQGGSVLITTSRRSGTEQTALLKQAVQKIPHYFYDWQSDAENPYQALLKTADQFIITEDSVSMLSECLVTGKPVYLFEFGQQNRFKALHQYLIHNRIISIIGQQLAKSYQPIVPAIVIAKEILAKIKT